MIPESEWKFFEATEQRLKHFRQHQEENLVALMTGGTSVTDPEGLAGRIATVLQEMDYPARVEQALQMDPTPEQARHLDLHRRGMLASMFETHPELAPLLHDLAARMFRHRPRLRDRDVDRSEVLRILRFEDDRDLREDAFDAAGSLAPEVEEDLKALFAMREALARSVVGAGFPQVAFHVQDLDRTRVLNLLDGSERTLRDAYDEARAHVAEATGNTSVEPWDLLHGAAKVRRLSPDAFPAGAALDAAHLQARRWGFEPSELGIGVETHAALDEAWTIALEIPGEIRILAPPAEGFDAYRLLFRAYGRALAHALAASRRHFLERESPAMVEAAGVLFEGVLSDPEWVEEHTGASKDAIASHLTACRMERLFALRLRHARHAFENLVYATGDVDPQKLYGDVMEPVLSCTKRSTPLWASHPEYVTHPFRSGAVLLGEHLAAQLRESLEANLPGSWNREETGAWLREEVFAAGASLPPFAKVERLTGREPDLESLRREAGAARFAGPRLEGQETITDKQVEEYFKDIDLGDLDLD